MIFSNCVKKDYTKYLDLDDDQLAIFHSYKLNDKVKLRYVYEDSIENFIDTIGFEINDKSLTYVQSNNYRNSNNHYMEGFISFDDYYGALISAETSKYGKINFFGISFTKIENVQNKIINDKNYESIYLITSSGKDTMYWSNIGVVKLISGSIVLNLID